MQLNQASVADLANFDIKTWGLLRSRKYGLARLDKKTLKITKAEVQANGKSLTLSIDDLEKVDVITIYYRIKNTKRESLKGSIQGTIHQLGNYTIY